MNKASFIRMVLAAALCAGLAASLLIAIAEVNWSGTDLTTLAYDNLQLSGVANPVTAVLLNYRAFDTLLELAVLLVTLVGVWSLALNFRRERLTDSAVLRTLLRLSAPFLIMLAAYLLWVGAKAPGGAFQAGAALAGLGVLLHLAGVDLLSRAAMRLLAIVGLAVFGLGALLLLAISGAMLQYPPRFAGALILMIETAATLSIGATLTAMFVGQANNKEAVR